MYNLQLYPRVPVHQLKTIITLNIINLARQFFLQICKINILNEFISLSEPSWCVFSYHNPAYPHVIDTQREVEHNRLNNNRCALSTLTYLKEAEENERKKI